MFLVFVALKTEKETGESQKKECELRTREGQGGHRNNTPHPEWKPYLEKKRGEWGRKAQRKLYNPIIERNTSLLLISKRTLGPGARSCQEKITDRGGSKEKTRKGEKINPDKLLGPQGKGGTYRLPTHPTSLFGGGGGERFKKKGGKKHSMKKKNRKSRQTGRH